MTEITGFRFEEDLLERFLGVEEALYADDPLWAQLPRRHARPQLTPDTPFFAAGGEHRNFIARGAGDAVQGRITAMLPPSSEGSGGPRQGLVGFFECAEDEGVAGALLEAACGWLRARGVSRVLGPLNFSTWYPYRFVTGGFERGPFLLEPYHKPYYAGLFERAGFSAFQTYASIETRHVDGGALFERPYRKALAAGIRFETLEPGTVEERLPVFYELARRIFAGKTAYSEVTYQEFCALYAGMGALVRPGLCHLAHDAEGAPVGFFFGYPDLLEPLRRGDPAAPVETTVLKTLAVAPGAPRSLGWALTHLHTQAALEQGYTTGIFALMEKYEQILRYAQRTGRDGAGGGEFKRYTLYARDLGA